MQYTITFFWHLAEAPIHPGSPLHYLPPAVSSGQLAHVTCLGFVDIADAHNTAGVMQMLCSGHIRVFHVCNKHPGTSYFLCSQHCVYTHTHNKVVFLGSPQRTTHTRGAQPAHNMQHVLSHDAINSMCTRQWGSTQLGLLHTRSAVEAFLFRKSPKIYIIYGNPPHVPYIWQITRLNTG